jgi:DNA-binding protein HU-beta
MNKTTLIETLAAELGTTKVEARRSLEATLGVISVALSNGTKVSIDGFGNFDTAQRAARQGRNPATGESIQIAASTQVKFKPAKKLKEIVNA